MSKEEILGAPDSPDIELLESSDSPDSVVGADDDDFVEMVSQEERSSANSNFDLSPDPTASVNPLIHRPPASKKQHLLNYLSQQGKTETEIQHENNHETDEVGPRKREYPQEVEEGEVDVPQKRARPSNEYNPPAPEDQRNSIGWQLLKKLGHKEGKGLGKSGQGRLEPVGLSTQRGTRGLGAKEPEGLEIDFQLQWDQNKEIIYIEEFPEWIPPCKQDPPTEEELSGWMKTGPEKLTIEDETKFCSKEILGQMLKSKSVFDELNDRDLRNARTRANPYETIKGVFFQNRAAMKTANMDAVFNWLLTDPLDPFQSTSEEGGAKKPWVLPNSPDLYYFADVCAGPGGFTEYVLWKKGWNAHGFGFTLKGKDDFKLDNFLAASPEMFEPFYGINGLDGDGDVMKPDNLKAFETFVLNTTKDGKGVHLYMADGGFSVEGKENIQEILSKRLYLCQFLCGLLVLRPGGNFLCKLFDLFTLFSVGLVYLMYRVFDRVCIHKPNTSRPANSERYIICKGLRETGVRLVKEYMRMINDKLEAISKEKEVDPDSADVVQVVPLEVINEDENFFHYIVNSNEKFARRQAVYLEKYRTFAQNTTLMEMRQENLREDCLKYWNIPDCPRAPPPRPSPQQALNILCPDELAQGQPTRWLHKRKGWPFSVEKLNIPNNYSGLDFRCFVATEEFAIVILALGRHFIFGWEGTRWEMMNNLRVKLPKNTLLTAEITQVYKGKGQGLQRTPMLRVIDAYFLAGENISNLPYDLRMEKVQKFCLAISKENSRNDLSWIRPAEFWKLKHLVNHKSRFGVAKIKGAERLVLYDYKPKDLEDGVSKTVPYIVCRGLYLQRIVCEPWLVCWSKSNRRAYYFLPPTSSGDQVVSIFEEDWERNKTLVSTFQHSQINRLIWDWTKVKDVRELLSEDKEIKEDDKGDKVLSISYLCHFVTD